jgi:hypothetical protein
MHSENEIRRAIKPLLTVYGELDTSEIKKLLHTVLEFDEDDKKKSPTRNEYLIIQRIGNIVAHQKEAVKVYPEGFVVNKNAHPAKFTLLNPISQNAVSPNDVTQLKARTNNFTARKVDWEKARDRNNELGDQGEEFVMEYEIDRLTDLLMKDAKQYVLHLSRLQGDGLGYDVLSINENGLPRYIEVKTTSGSVDTPFYMSNNEKRFFEEYGDSAFIYRVYNFKRETRRGEVKIISQTELLSDYKFDPVTWLVTHI